MEPLKLIFFAVLLTTCILFFYYIRSEKVIEKNLLNMFETLDEASMKRAKEAQRDILFQTREDSQKGIRKFITKASKLFQYSGINFLFSDITFEIWTVLILASAAIVYFVSFSILKNVGKTLILLVLYLALVVVIEKFLAYRNYKLVERNLLKFLNMLESFNFTSGEITSLFLKTSRYIPNPLKTVLEECYDDAHTLGDTTVALYAMADKIEHPGFKDIICNLEICMHHSANYAETIKSCRKMILDEQRIKKDRKALTNEVAANVILISILILFAFVITDGLISRSFWDILFHTFAGKICIAVMTAIYVFLFYKIATVEKG